jgi:hypothetical protein
VVLQFNSITNHKDFPIQPEHHLMPVSEKVINKNQKKVEESGVKWIIFSYFSVFIEKERLWPHL